MEIPIANALYLKNSNFIFDNNNFDYKLLNRINFIKPNVNNFPLLKILKYKLNNTFFEIILVSINDALVKKYLNNQISYISIHKTMLVLLKKPYLKKYYSSKPKNINEIKNMVKKVNQYLDLNLKKNERTNKKINK